MVNVVFGLFFELGNTRAGIRDNQLLCKVGRFKGERHDGGQDVTVFED